MQVLADSKTQAAGESKSQTLPVRLQPADAMKVIQRLAEVPGAMVDLSVQKWEDSEVEREMYKPSRERTEAVVYPIHSASASEESNIRLALYANGTWEIWAKIEV